MMLGVAPAHAKGSAPVISGRPASSVVATKYYWFQATAKDADRDRLTFDIKNRPRWARFEPKTGQLYGTPARGDVGTFKSITISVTDGRTKVGLRPFDIKVLGVIDRPPAISGAPSRSVVVGQRYQFRPKVTAGSDRRLVFSVRNRPWWLTFDKATGLLQGTPGANGLGNYRDVVLSVSDGEKTASLPAFTIAVTAATVARVDSVTLDWMPPTHNTDTSTLTDLAGYRIYYGKNPSSLTNKVSITQTGLTRYVLDNLETGTWYFALAAYNRLGSESKLTQPVSTVIR
jgi:hypothetical protein